MVAGAGRHWPRARFVAVAPKLLSALILRPILLNGSPRKILQVRTRGKPLPHSPHKQRTEKNPGKRDFSLSLLRGQDLHLRPQGYAFQLRLSPLPLMFTRRICGLDYTFSLVFRRLGICRLVSTPSQPFLKFNESARAWLGIVTRLLRKISPTLTEVPSGVPTE